MSGARGWMVVPPMRPDCADRGEISSLYVVPIRIACSVRGRVVHRRQVVLTLVDWPCAGLSRNTVRHRLMTRNKLEELDTYTHILLLTAV